MQDVSGVVVAGGKSRRLGEDKRKLRLWGGDGPTLLEHTLGVLAPLCSELVVVLNDPDDWRALPARLVPDAYPDGGALGGIYTGLRTVTNAYAVVVAADMPLLNPDLLRAMLSLPRDYDALLPRSPRPDVARNALNVEPLHAIYSRTCLEPLRAVLDQGRRRIIDFLDAVRVVTLEPDEIARYDPHGYSFLNVNTPEELARVRRLLERR
jgi:molybdopterin-guanine dinucleotide biosynthesis protein A